jgi:D-alanyl-D-alanine carboxypeptidase
MEQFDQPALDDLAARVLDTGMAPAIAVALTDHERTTMTPTFGAASPDALWPIASIGKSFTAVIALQLVEEGLLDLHAPVTDYVPWLSVGSRFTPITLHHLLTHTAGVIANSDLAPASTYDVIALAHTEMGFPPGEHRHYSNVGIYSGTPYYRAVSWP